MTGLAYAFDRLHHGESEIHQHLLAIGARHRDEHEVFHVTTDLARWSQEHVRRIAEVAARYQITLDAEASAPGLTSRLGEVASTLSGRRPEPGLLLLEDLRQLYLMASDNSLAWEMLAQHAQAKRESDILQLTEACHPQNLRQLRWANTMIKTLSPQILAAL